MDLGIKNKWALITGGANGIGEQISIDLAKNGVNLLITSRDQKNLKHIFGNFTLKSKKIFV